MTFLLSSQNVGEYIAGLGLCTQEEQAKSQIELKHAKNFNLLVSLPEGRKLLVKQERYDQKGKTAGEFLAEWRIQKFLQQFPELIQLRCWLPEVLHFDPDNSIIVFNYLDDYCDLLDFYTKENIFPPAISTSIGAILAAIHRLTLDRQDYRHFFSQNPGVSIDNVPDNKALDLSQRLEQIGPEVFGKFPADGLKFFALYQRYDSLGQAIADLGNAFEPCCLTHNDFKVNNILLSLEWEQVLSPELQSGNSVVRLIDWERSSWGDPAFDLGMIVANYLAIWLISLISNKAIKIEESLSLAKTPLELIQPSIAALAGAYFEHFPEILQRRPDFLKRVVQFVGLGLIQFIQVHIEYRKPFGNSGIFALQVAKTLLCRPEASIPTVFGVEESKLTRLISNRKKNAPNSLTLSNK